MPCAPVLERPLLFLSPFESHGFCVLLFSMFGLEILCHFGRFYLSASVGVRGPGFGLKSLWDKGWSFNQPGVGLWSECFSPGFHIFYLSCCLVVVGYGAADPRSSTESIHHK